MSPDGNCYRCSRPISRAEVEDGLVIRAERGLICADCIARERQRRAALRLAEAGKSLKIQSAGPSPEVRPDPEDEEEPQEDEKEERPPARERLYEDDPEAILLRILDELKPIRQAVYYHHSSLWNVLGGVIQIFAVALMGLAVVRWDSPGGPTDFLLLAVLVQLLAFTCFVNGK